MALDRKDVERVARLARLELRQEEIELFTEQLGRVIAYVDKLSELDLSREAPMMHAAEGAPLRADEVGTRLAHGEALEGAPASSDGFFRVPPVIE